MGFAKLELSSTPARLNLTQTPARIQISRGAPDIRIEHGDNSLRIESTPGSVDIDSTAARQSVGYYTPLAFGDEMVAYSLRQASRGIRDLAAAGDQLARIGGGGNAIAALSFDRQYVDSRDRQFVIAFVPKVPPRIRITPRRIRIDVSYTPPRVQIAYNRPMITTEPARLSISTEPASLAMRAVPASLDMTL